MTKTKRTWIMMMMGLGTTITVGIWINILTSSMLAPGTTLMKAIKTIGWTNGWLIFGLTISVYQVILTFCWNRYDVKQRNILKQSSIKLQNDLYYAMLNVVTACIKSFKPDIKINVRFFEHLKRNGKSILQKNHQLHISSEPFPNEVGLEEAFVDEDNLVMCEAFKKKTPLYEELEEDHIKRYGPRIKNSVDPTQRWVLACPVLYVGNSSKDPIGVIVFYGSTPPVEGDEDVLLKEIANHLSKCFFLATNLENYLND